MLLIFFNYICVYLISARCSTHPPPPPVKKEKIFRNPPAIKHKEQKPKQKITLTSCLLLSRTQISVG